jgi:tetratricopeptide (TPR) repeat protein
MKDRIFQRADWVCGAIAALVAFIGYAWTTAPSVTLLDSGEFLVAAQHFGVPHPTGYPLWTLLAWLFHLLPLGNVAWQTALFSGVCGALAVGLAAMLVRSTAVWMAPQAGAMATACALSLSLVFAFSFSMWSQAVIIEVYALHALLIGLYLTSLYAWIRRPERLSGLYWSFFLLSLAFSNHQLTLVYAVFPLQFLVIVLLRRDLFWDLFLSLAVCALIAYLSFALLADNTLVLKAALRLCYLVATVLVIALILKRGRIQWKLIVYLPLVLLAGLLPYAYMPLASSTNPPMNWGYTRTPEGFFYSFNRSQYSGSLSDLSLRVFSKTLGVSEDDPAMAPKRAAQAAGAPSSTSLFAELREWTGFFWFQLLRSFSPLGALFFLLAFFGALRVPNPAFRTWIYLLVVAFVLAMCVQPVLEHAQTDANGWWQQMPYHTYTNLIFSVLCGIGAFVAMDALARRWPALRHASWALLLLPLWPIAWNAAGASQRNHWFGWKFGHDMLADLPKGAVVFGGTDPGRFVPTYMILGESSLPPSRRIDPAFDRDDLYILTQNGLGDRYYLSYIRDQYTTDRPQTKNAFERWLGRDRAYPDEPLELPTRDQMREIEQKAIREFQKKNRSDILEANWAGLGALAQWIFEHNKGRHAFYVEESFPMKWSYAYAIPDGLVYRLAPEPLVKLPAEVVAKDFAFWDKYIAGLKSDPAFAGDYDAQRSFSKLRVTGGHIYDYRKMTAQAEAAYRQALDLWPANPEALDGLVEILSRKHRFDEALALLERARKDDPRSDRLLSMIDLVAFHKEAQARIDELLPTWRANPTQLEPLRKIVQLCGKAGDEDQLDAILVEAIPHLGQNPKFLEMVIQISESLTRWQQASDAATRWVQADPKSAEAFYRLARAQVLLRKKPEAVASLTKALELGGVEYRERLFADPVFQSLKDAPELQSFMVARPPAEQNSVTPPALSGETSRP